MFDTPIEGILYFKKDIKRPNGQISNQALRIKNRRFTAESAEDAEKNSNVKAKNSLSPCGRGAG